MRMRSSMLVLLSCIRLADINNGENDVGNMCLVMLMVFWFLWKIVCLRVFWVLYPSDSCACCLVSAVCWHYFAFIVTRGLLRSQLWSSLQYNFVPVLYAFVFSIQPENVRLFSSTCAVRLSLTLLSPAFISLFLCLRYCEFTTPVNLIIVIILQNFL